MLDGDPIPETMPHGSSILHRNDYARAAGVVMNVWLWLARIMLAHVAHAVVGMVVMVTAIMLVAMMVMMAMISMTKLSPVMGVNEKAGKGTSGYCCSHTERGRQREHGNHRPDEGHVASAYSFQLRQHRLSFFRRPIRHPRAL
ncbi:MAG: hypothetical protein ACKVP3_16385 [Hyphomicrobiaceae bacterium]